MIFARYLAREFAKINGFIVVFFLSMYCVIDFLEKNTRYFPKYDASGPVILEYYVTQLPKMFVDLLPFSTMFAAVVVQSSELQHVHDDGYTEHLRTQRLDLEKRVGRGFTI